MIRFRMKDGTQFFHDVSKLTLVVGEGENEKTFGWEDILAVTCIDGSVDVADGRIGGGMPIRALVWHDPSDIRVEFPMPLELARGLGEALMSSKVEIAKAMPSAIQPIEFGRRRLGG